MAHGLLYQRLCFVAYSTSRTKTREQDQHWSLRYPRSPSWSGCLWQSCPCWPDAPQTNIMIADRQQHQQRPPHLSNGFRSKTLQLLLTSSITVNSHRDNQAAAHMKAPCTLTPRQPQSLTLIQILPTILLLVPITALRAPAQKRFRPWQPRLPPRPINQSPSHSLAMLSSPVSSGAPSWNRFPPAHMHDGWTDSAACCASEL